MQVYNEKTEQIEEYTCHFFQWLSKIPIDIIVSIGLIAIGLLCWLSLKQYINKDDI